MRNALDLRIARAISPKDEVVSSRRLKALRNVRVGNFVSLRLLHLVDKSDSGTNDEPLKGMAAAGRDAAQLLINETFEVLKDAVMIASPETVSAAMPFFTAFRKKLLAAIKDGAPWDDVSKYYRSIVHKISAPSRRFFAGDGGGHVGASFDADWVEAYSQAKEELERSLTKAAGFNAAKMALDARDGGKKGGPKGEAPQAPAYMPNCFTRTPATGGAKSEVVCMDFNNPNKGCWGRRCTRVHKCPRKLADGRMCWGDHPQFEHKD